MNKKWYDILSWIGRILLPAVATLWLALAKLWGLPYQTEIAGTITAIATFINAILKIESNNYFNKNEG